MDTKFSQYLLNSKELADFALYSFTDYEEHLNYLLKHQFLLVVDWRGEEMELQIGIFLQNRAASLSPGSDLDVKEIYAKMNIETENESLTCGDSVPFLLRKFQVQLKKIRLAIVLLDLGNDNYYIGVMQEIYLKELKKQSDPLWKFVTLGSRSGEILYTINCSCGSMNVWQVKRGEQIRDDLCQDCGKELFDREGNSFLPLIREYI